MTKRQLRATKAVLRLETLDGRLAPAVDAPTTSHGLAMVSHGHL